MLIDIFHDTVCPWCRIGKKHLFDAIRQRQNEKIEIRWHPFLLDNAIPPAGYEFRSFMLARKGINSIQLQQMFDYTQSVGEAAGVKLNFEKISLAVNSTLSHQLITLTPENIKSNVVEAIYQAYFEFGLNIGDIDVLVNIGTANGMDSTKLRYQVSTHAALDAVLAESALAHSQGIASVPLFVINNKVRVEGSHSVEVFLQALNRAGFLETSGKIW